MYMNNIFSVEMDLLAKSIDLFEKYNDIFKIEEFLKYHKLDILYNRCYLQKMDSRQDRIINRMNMYKDEIEFIFQKALSKKIKLVLLKGFSLRQIYGERYLWRYCSDIDILVSRTQLKDVEQILIDLGYSYGFVVNGEIIKPTRQQLIFKRMYTHEIYPMFKIKDGYKMYVDVNFLFSWRGIEDNESIQLIGNDWLQTIDQNNLTMNKKFNLLHLCVHFYNEAVYFSFDDAYTGGDPKELRLFRLFDIILLLNDFDKNDMIEFKKLSVRYNCETQISFVFRCIREIYGDEYLGLFKELFDINDIDVNYYYTKSGEKKVWEYCLLSRVFDNKIRKNIIDSIDVN